MAEGDGSAAGGGNPVLRFFGLHTVEQASGTALWVAPYLGLFLCGLILLSVLVQRFLPLPLWVHLLAVGIAAVNCFFFLARIRQSMLADDQADGDGGPGLPSDEG